MAQGQWNSSYESTAQIENHRKFEVGEKTFITGEKSDMNAFKKGF